MFEMENSKVFMMFPNDKYLVRGKAAGFYIYRDMLGRTAIEEVVVEEGQEKWITGNEAVKPFLLILCNIKAEKKTKTKEK